jgi:hypothetical protein
MKLQLKFNEADFKNMREFDRAVKRQLGNNCYVGSDSLCLYFDYPKELVAMLRPFPQTKQMEFELESSCPDEKKNWK